MQLGFASKGCKGERVKFAAMKFRILTFFAAAFAPALLPAQIALHGIQQGSNQELILSSMEVLDGIFYDVDTLEFVDAYLVGGSAFDQIQGTFFLTGLTSVIGGNMNLWGIDIDSDEIVSTAPVNEVIGGVQHDMNTDRLVAIGSAIIDSTLNEVGDMSWWMYEYGTRLIEFDATTGAIEELAVYPDITGYVVGCVALNSDNGELHFVGVDSNYDQRLYTLDSFTGEILASPMLQLDSGWGVNELTYSMSSGKLYALHREFGDLGEGQIHLAALEPASGAIADLMLLPQVAAISPDASEFAQSDGVYIIMYYDINFGRHILAVDPESTTVVADHPLPGSFTEMHVDNGAFAAAAYGNAPTDVAEVQAAPEVSLAMFPNPASSVVTLNWPSDNSPSFVRVRNVTGEEVAEHHLAGASGFDLHVGGWPAGVYVVESHSATGSAALERARLVVVD